MTESLNIDIVSDDPKPSDRSTDISSKIDYAAYLKARNTPKDQRTDEQRLLIAKRMEQLRLEKSVRRRLATDSDRVSKHDNRSNVGGSRIGRVEQRDRYDYGEGDGFEVGEEDQPSHRGHGNRDKIPNGISRYSVRNLDDDGDENGRGAMGRGDFGLHVDGGNSPNHALPHGNRSDRYGVNDNPKKRKRTDDPSGSTEQGDARKDDEIDEMDDFYLVRKRLARERANSTSHIHSAKSDVSDDNQIEDAGEKKEDLGVWSYAKPALSFSAFVCFFLLIWKATIPIAKNRVKKLEQNEEVNDDKRDEPNEEEHKSEVEEKEEEVEVEIPKISSNFIVGRQIIMDPNTLAINRQRAPFFFKPAQFESSQRQILPEQSALSW